MKLWFFRTLKGTYAVAPYKPDKGNFAMLDCGYGQGTESVLRRRPASLPALSPGECIPVELVPAKSKGKKARKE